MEAGSALASILDLFGRKFGKLSAQLLPAVRNQDHCTPNRTAAEGAPMECEPHKRTKRGGERGGVEAPY